MTVHVSALVTTYRRYVKCCRAIDAILRQTSPVVEIIVVDNASPDVDYKELASRYAGSEPPVNVVRLSIGTHDQPPLRDEAGAQIRPGTRDHTNVALSLARGDWVAICHDDDVWKPHRLERQRQALMRHGNCAAIGANVVNRSESGVEHGIHHDYYGPHGLPMVDGVTDVTRCVQQFNPLAISSMLIRTDVLVSVGGFGNWVADAEGRRMRSFGASDWDLYRRLAAVTPLLRVDEPLAWYEVGNRKFEGHMGHGN